MFIPILTLLTRLPRFGLVSSQPLFVSWRLEPHLLIHLLLSHNKAALSLMAFTSFTNPFSLFIFHGLVPLLHTKMHRRKRRDIFLIIKDDHFAKFPIFFFGSCTCILSRSQKILITRLQVHCYFPFPLWDKQCYCFLPGLSLSVSLATLFLSGIIEKMKKYKYLQGVSMTYNTSFLDLFVPIRPGSPQRNCLTAYARHAMTVSGLSSAAGCYFNICTWPLRNTVTNRYHIKIIPTTSHRFQNIRAIQFSRTKLSSK